MSYELVKETVIQIEERPCPCTYCDSGQGEMGSNGEYYDCHESCDLYKMWLEGAVVIPEGFAEGREI